MERSRLLASGRTSISSKTKRKKESKNVDSKFRNLADRNQVKVPTSVEQEILFKACLGYKKIQLCEEDKEDDLFKD